MELQRLKTERQDGTLVVTVNREAKLNALDLRTIQEFDAVFDEVYQDASIKGVIVTGAGSKAFVAGADISEIAQLSQEQAAQFARNGQRVFSKIEHCPKPVVAAVNGYALGGGCELAMACHVRVASDNAQFGQPEVKLGIIPGYGGTQRLCQLIGRGKALELMMTADNLNAEEALRLGLANHVVPAEALLETAKGLLGKIYRQGPVAIAKVIEAVNAYSYGTDGYEAEAKAFGEACATGDFKEGTQAFLEKRKPNFSGK